MSSDNTCKYLAETYASNFVHWLLGVDANNVLVLKTEIIPEPIRSDTLIIIQLSNKILHLEFQTLPYSTPTIPCRMLNYWTLLYGQYWCEVEQIVFYLKETTSELGFQNRFEVQNTSHSYCAIRLWEQYSTPFLSDPALLPLATLTRSNEPKALLEQVAKQTTMREEPARRRNISAAAEILAGLRFNKNLIRQLFLEELMQESVIYQDILQKGLVQGQQQGLQQGLQQGEAGILVRILARRFGAIAPNLDTKIRSLSIQQLDELTEAQFDFSSGEDL